jgi:uncharacterized protein YndB with AHSA1/START domain
MNNKAKITAEPGVQATIVERIFDASREKVFAALTQKDKLEKWWTGPGYGVRVDKVDARDGGAWQFVNIDNDGKEFYFHGSFHEVTAPERIIQTFEFDGLGERGHVALEKVELSELDDGRTLLRTTDTFMSVADRDGMIENGMEEGLQESYRQLDHVLKTME